MDKEKKTVIRIEVSAEEKAAIQEFQKLLGFKSQKAIVDHLLFVGLLTLEYTAGVRPFDAASFANALYTIGSHFLQGEFGDRNIEQTIKEFKAWQTIKGRDPQRSLGSGRVLVEPTGSLKPG